MNPDEAMARVKAALGLEVMIRMHPKYYEFWSWDGKYTSHRGQCLKSLVEEIELAVRAVPKGK